MKKIMTIVAMFLTGCATTETAKVKTTAVVSVEMPIENHSRPVLKAEIKLTR